MDTVHVSPLDRASAYNAMNYLSRGPFSCLSPTWMHCLHRQETNHRVDGRVE